MPNPQKPAPTTAIFSVVGISAILTNNASLVCGFLIKQGGKGLYRDGLAPLDSIQSGMV